MLDTKNVYNKPNIFNTKPEKNWRFIEFDGGTRKINGETYFYEHFVNSDDYIIHDITTIVNTTGNYNKITYHVWYEPKK